MDDKEIEKPEIELNEEVQSESSESTEQATEESPIQLLENQLSEAKDKHLRLFAEFDNFKKRNAKEKLEYMSMAGKDVLLEMISVKDDFERAMKSFENSDDLSAIKEGIELIYDKLNKSIEKKGVKKIEAKGQPFNVELHEAITEIPVGSEDQKGIVFDEIESGYTLHDKVIRFSKVVVGK
jgi:molecular chaperone GrpE